MELAADLCCLWSRLRYGDAMRYADKIVVTRQRIKQRPITVRTAAPLDPASLMVLPAHEPRPVGVFRPNSRHSSVASQSGVTDMQHGA